MEAMSMSFSPLSKEDANRRVQMLLNELMKYDGSFEAGYALRDSVIPHLNRLICARLTQCIRIGSHLSASVVGTYAEEIQSNGFRLTISLYSSSSAMGLRMNEVEQFMLDDSFARKVAGNLIALAAREFWLR